MNQQTIEKITNAAIAAMVRRANIEMTGSYEAKVVNGSDIVSAVMDDPTGNTAFRLAEYIVLGINYYEAATA